MKLLQWQKLHESDNKYMYWQNIQGLHTLGECKPIWTSCDVPLLPWCCWGWAPSALGHCPAASSSCPPHLCCWVAPLQTVWSLGAWQLLFNSSIHICTISHLIACIFNHKWLVVKWQKLVFSHEVFKVMLRPKFVSVASALMKPQTCIFNSSPEIPTHTAAD